MRSEVLKKNIFNWLVKNYYKRVLRTCLFYLKNKAEAEDITQEVFLKAFEKIDFSKVGESKFPILFLMAKNLSLNRLKSRSWSDESMPEWDSESPCDTPEESYLKKEGIKQVNRTLRSLKKEEREVIVMKHYQECSYKEISEILDIPMGTVMSRLYSARKKLAKSLRSV